VFLIGMRFNQLWRVRSWLPVAGAMPRMLKHLMSEPEYGLLGFQNWFGRTTIMVSYWRSGRRRAAVRLRSRRAARRGLAGLHPTDRRQRPGRHLGTSSTPCTAGTYEAVYANMPRFWPGRRAGSRPGRSRTAHLEAADGLGGVTRHPSTAAGPGPGRTTRPPHPRMAVTNELTVSTPIGRP
jgi:hypothetical protein